MAQTYKQIQKQIEQLQRKAEALRNGEIKGVVERIKVAIAHYGLTAAHLGFEAGRSATKTKPAAKSAGKAKAKSNSKFADANGNAWSGFGPRPHWLRDALNAGRSIDEFRVGATSKAAASATAQAETAKPTAKATAKKSKRAPSRVIYSDDAGHSWTGRGPKPRWLKAALESGKSLQDFAK